MNKNILLIISLVLLGKIISLYGVTQARPYMAEYISTEVKDEGDRNFLLSKFREESASPLVYGLGYHLDSKYYMNIAEGGYYKEILYAFPPLYPMIIKLVSFGFDKIFAAILISNLFYMSSIVLFYRTALLYLDERSSAIATLCYAFFPTNFAYGTIAYSEPVFLAFAIGSWYFFEKGGYMLSGFLMFLASLTRYTGLLLFPITSVIYVWRELRGGTKSYKRIAVNLVVLNILSGITLYWLFVVLPSKNTSFNAVQAKWGTHISYPFSWIIFLWRMGLPSAVHITLFFLLFFVLGFLLYGVNRGLLFYSISFIVFYTSVEYVASGWSFAMCSLRFLGTVWPVYLAMGVKLRDPLNLAPFLPAVTCWV